MKKFRIWFSFMFVIVLVVLGQKVTYATEGYTEDVIPKMTSEKINSPSPISITSNSNYNSNHLGWKAFDNDEGVWKADGNNTTGGNYIIIDFGPIHKKKIEMLTLSGFSEGGANSLKDWVLYGSNDNKGWTKVTSGTHG
jgi:hypothetical protein